MKCIPTTKRIKQMTTTIFEFVADVANHNRSEIMTLNEFIADVSNHNLINYVQDKIDDMYTDEEFDEKTNNYLEGDYKIHLDYLIETWKNLIDECFVDDFKINYDRQGTFNELWDYCRDTSCPEFDDTWLDDIFERHILDTNICLK